MQLDRYISELNKVKLLAYSEEQELWQAYKEQGSQQARSRLIESYQPLVFKTAEAFLKLDNIMDVIQEGTVGLIEAVECYDYTRGVAFSIFAVHRIRGRMYNFLKKEDRADICLSGSCFARQGIWLGAFDRYRDACAGAGRVAGGLTAGEKSYGQAAGKGVYGSGQHLYRLSGSGTGSSAASCQYLSYLSVAKKRCPESKRYAVKIYPSMEMTRCPMSLTSIGSGMLC